MRARRQPDPAPARLSAEERNAHVQVAATVSFPLFFVCQGIGVMLPLLAHADC